MRRPTIQAVLFLGFGLTLGLWLVAGYQFTQRMTEVERETAAISARYMRAQELLAAVRAHILLASVFVRDALLEADPAALTETRRRLDETYRATTDALNAYEPVLDPPESERDRIANLRSEFQRYREAMDDVLSTDATTWPANARTLLSERIVPRREMVIRLSEEVQALNRSAFLGQQARMAEVYEDSQRRVWQQLGLALGASLGIALFATLYAGRLENRIRVQAARDAQNRLELQQLSRRLVGAQEEERRAIARELHDEVGQALMAIKVELSVARRAQEADPGPALDAARSITDGALQVVRDLSQLLRPTLLDDLGLATAIHAHARTFERRYHLPVEVAESGLADRLSPDIETAAYRIVQEGLTNIARHAGATRARVQLDRANDTLRISIEDDGIGFDAEAHHRRGGTGGLGLIGIRERAAELGGTFTLESARGRGTRLIVALPGGAAGRDVHPSLETRPQQQTGAAHG